MNTFGILALWDFFQRQKRSRGTKTPQKERAQGLNHHDTTCFMISDLAHVVFRPGLCPTRKTPDFAQRCEPEPAQRAIFEAINEDARSNRSTRV